MQRGGCESTFLRTSVIEESDFDSLDFELLADLCGLYNATNLTLLQSFVQKRTAKAGGDRQ